MKREYGRTTITVPLELKKRMKQARAHANWSAIACDAFEQKLAELSPIEDITSVEAATKRMKSLNQRGPESIEGVCQSGKEAGTRWALNFARPSQLERIEDFRNEVPDDQWDELMTARDGWQELGRCIERQPGPGPHSFEHFANGDSWDEVTGRPSRHRRRRMRKIPGQKLRGETDIWRSILDHRPDHPEFYLGFAEGALEVWKQIKDQL